MSSAPSTLSEPQSQSGHLRNSHVDTRSIAQPAAKARTIPTIDVADLDPEKFRTEHVLRGTPLLIRGIAPDQIFSWTEFCREMREQEVFVCEHGKNRGPKWQWARYAYQYPLRVEEYIRMINDGRAEQRDIYMSFVKVGVIKSTARARKFLDDFALRFGLRKLYPDMEGYLWIGVPGHVEPLHSDEGDGTLYQVAGVKRIALFPPEQIHNLYPFPLFGPVPPWVCQVDLDQPDHQRFPRLGEALAARLEVVLEPGDMIYLPSQWSHEVRIVSGAPCISINRQWKLSPWRRNFCTSRSTLWFFKRLLPRNLLIRAHAFLSTLRKPGKSIHYTPALRRNRDRKTKGG